MTSSAQGDEPPARALSADLLGHGRVPRSLWGGRLGADRRRSALEQRPVRQRPASIPSARRGRSPSSTPSAKSSRIVENGKIEQLGFYPADTNWWPYSWGYSCSARGSGTAARTSPSIRRKTSAPFPGFRATRSATTSTQLQELHDEFGTSLRRRNPFLSGKLAMVLQGVWMGNFIQKYSPHMRWGAAPFPPRKAGGAADRDRGRRHAGDSERRPAPEGSLRIHPVPGAARPDGKALPRAAQDLAARARSARSSFGQHKNPYIRMFQDLARAPAPRPSRR